jgi:GntR family transcriptional regulator, transcriptional repressor for pyruvate dehydrogenase complex
MSRCRRAIQQRPGAAAEAHLSYVEMALGELKKSEKHDAIARQRLEHVQNRA